MIGVKRLYGVFLVYIAKKAYLGLKALIQGYLTPAYYYIGLYTYTP